ncbi:MAG: pentapeptide repeat-containing protein [Cyclobacteriaceae bacterium]
MKFLTTIPFFLIFCYSTTTYSQIVLKYEDRSIEEKIRLHQRWRQNNGGKQMVLNGEDLRGVNFSSNDLGEAIFRNCNLSYSMFTGTTKLYETRFINCDLSNSTFAGSDIRGAMFEKSRLKNSSFDQAKISGSEFEAHQDEVLNDSLNINFKNVLSKNNRFIKFSFETIDIDQSSFTKDTFGNCKMYNKDFRTLSQVRDISFINTDINGSIFKNLNLGRSLFSDVSGIGVDFENTTMNFCIIIKNSYFGGSNFRGVKLNMSFVNESNFSSCAFHNAVFNNSEIRTSIFEGANLTDAEMINTDFSGSNFHLATILPDPLENANFSGCIWIDGSTVCDHQSFGNCREEFPNKK